MDGWASLSTESGYVILESIARPTKYKVRRRENWSWACTYVWMYLVGHTCVYVCLCMYAFTHVFNDLCPFGCFFEAQQEQLLLGSFGTDVSPCRQPFRFGKFFDWPVAKIPTRPSPRKSVRP